ncbi:sugar nucleotide-binding protein [Candidatus Pelagibacter sp.]|nr:sugar nucleotide-binding protein [Candidatus Pelagibacter sp.]
MKILILGSSGFLGSTIYKTLSKNFKVFHNGLRKKKFDLSSKKQVHELIFKSKPNIIINCAAITNINYCEKNKKKTKLINSDLLRWINNYNKKLKKSFWLIHFSTDSLYYKNKKNTEKDKTKVFNYYTKSKLLAENYCQYKSLILRTNFFGKTNFKNNSFSDFIFKSFKSKKKIFLLNDVFFNPLRAITIAKILKHILKKGERYYGVYNLGSNGFLSKYEFATYFAKKARIFDLDCFQIINSKKFFKIKRPNFMMMSVKKFEKSFNYKLPELKKEIIKEIQENYENI